MNTNKFETKEAKLRSGKEVKEQVRVKKTELSTRGTEKTGRLIIKKIKKKKKKEEQGKEE